jgi:hypothetical protein
MVTAEGRWYHIPEAALREYAGAVLDHVTLDDLLRWADVWVDSPRTVTLWALPALLWALPNGWAVVAALGLYVAWSLLSPALPSIGAVRVASGLTNVFVQGGYYVLTLSALAAAGYRSAMWVGLGAFVLFRWGVIDWAGGTVLRSLLRRLYPLPVTDQVLRGLIVRAALRYRVSVPQVDALTADILENWGAQTDPDADSDASAPSS